jgi:phosphatidylethanolamine/phosphatidyl-N-methylethanolamine N-methyltransferase
VSTSLTADAVGFFRAWLSNPLRVAAVVPSGRALSDAMTAEISAETGPVIELGPRAPGPSRERCSPAGSRRRTLP